MALASRLGDTGSIIDRKSRAGRDRTDSAPAGDRELATRRRRTGTVPFAGHGADAAADPRNDSRRRSRPRGGSAIVGSRRFGGWKTDRRNGPIGSTSLRESPGKILTIDIRARRHRAIRFVLTPSERTGDDGNAYGYVGVAPLMREVEYGVFAAIPMSLHETASKTMMTLDLMKKMVTGLVFDAESVGPDHDCEGGGRFGAFGWLGEFPSCVGVAQHQPRCAEPVADSDPRRWTHDVLSRRDRDSATGAGSSAGMGHADRPRHRRRHDAARVLQRHHTTILI